MAEKPRANLKFSLRLINYLAIVGIACGAVLLAVISVPGNKEFFESFQTAPEQLRQSFQFLIDVILFVSIFLMIICGLALFLSANALFGLSKLERECWSILSYLKPQEAGADLHAFVAALKNSVNSVVLQLRESGKNQRTVMEKSVDVICVIDVNFKVKSINKACLRSWGYSPSELEGRSVLDLLVSSDTEQVISSFIGAVKSIDQIIFECHLKRKNGELIDVVWTAHWSASEGGLFCIVHDITERKRAAEEVKASESRLRITLESLPVGVLICSSTKVVEFANSYACNLYGASTAQLVGQAVDKLFSSDVLGNVRAEQPGAEPIKTVASLALRNDGSSFFVEVSTSSIVIFDDNRLMLIFVDKTEQQELERLKQNFIAMVIHELRTPITSMSGLLLLLQDGAIGQVSEDGKKMAANIQKDTKRIIRLINDLLDLERMQAGAFKLEINRISLKDVVEHAVSAVQIQADAKNLDIVAEVAATACWADRDRLIQVLVNLISNAIKFSDAKATIRISARQDEQLLRVFVSDEGRGIPADKLEKVFARFEQVESSDASKKGGSGLGLSICKGLIEAHGGEIGLTSEVGKGSTFWFSLPLSPEA